MSVCMASRPGPRTIQLDEFQSSRGAVARIDPVAPPPQKRERQMLRNHLAVISDGICGIVPLHTRCAGKSRSCAIQGALDDCHCSALLNFI